MTRKPAFGRTIEWPYELMLGLRYMRSTKSASKNEFISFISLISMIGIALGVAALIIVLSVMNGFQKEVRDRMLGVVAHVEVLSGLGEGLQDAQGLERLVREHPAVTAVAPFVAAQALIARGDAMQGVMVRGIDPQRESQVNDALGHRSTGVGALVAGEFGAVLGRDLAHNLGVVVGDTIALVAPSAQVSPVGVAPRLKQLKVLGTFESGHYEYDANLVFLHVQDAARLFNLSGAMGLRIKLARLHDAPRVGMELEHSLYVARQSGRLADAVRVRDWTRQNKAWFAAVQVEKTMMFTILTLIVAVAAFNLVSTLVMTVQDKRSDIAILRTLGATPRSVMWVFVVQGAMAGVMGTLVGLGLGMLVALNLDVIVPAIEALLQTSFLPKEIYLISVMPSDPQGADIVPVVLIALALAFVATLYPSWRAAKVDPAQALRYE